MPYLQTACTIETDRLILRAPLWEDVDSLAAIFGDPVAMRTYFFGKPYGRRDVLAMLPAVADHYAMHGFGALTMCLKPFGTIVGLTGLSYVPSFANVQLGWVLAKEYWRRGFAFESGTALLGHAFDVRRLRCVEATTRVDNSAAIATIERLRMQRGALYHESGVEFVRYRTHLETARLLKKT